MTHNTHSPHGKGTSKESWDKPPRGQPIYGIYLQCAIFILVRCLRKNMDTRRRAPVHGSMKNRPKVGMSGETRFVVAPEHVIDFAEGGMPAVLATPRLIGLLEKAARDLLLPFLEPGERSVGVEIELRHLAPTPLGESVVCLVRVIQAEGSEVSFHVEARDKHEPIARGYHKRQVIRVDRFSKRVQRKQ